MIVSTCEFVLIRLTLQYTLLCTQVLVLYLHMEFALTELLHRNSTRRINNNNGACVFSFTYKMNFSQMLWESAIRHQATLPRPAPSIALILFKECFEKTEQLKIPKRKRCFWQALLLPGLNCICSDGKASQNDSVLISSWVNSYRAFGGQNYFTELYVMQGQVPYRIYLNS